MLSFIVCRKSGIEIDFDAINQRLKPFRKPCIHCLQALGVTDHVVDQEGQELSEHRVVAFGDFVCVNTTSPLGKML
ncbi:hypothetical protein SAMN05421693_11280 [Ectothiorhodospira magna]|uniref:Uncharacterized protein n=1 Tax=Ectothiorhodospira magna TaxID=867345 RepID=A0A1H9C7E4_9GAMM|nr:hypothetical protein [Ectothiorhodospira magna]SEP97064.1 hypothetical protein SAMN05421693_11280 [Ectothiorhodospira magna]